MTTVTVVSGLTRMRNWNVYKSRDTSQRLLFPVIGHRELDDPDFSRVFFTIKRDFDGFVNGVPTD